MSRLEKWKGSGAAFSVLAAAAWLLMANGVAGAGNSFAPTGSMSSPHAEAAGDVVEHFLSPENGFVVISGGYPSAARVATKAATIYNPSLGTFSDIPGGLNIARGDHTETAIAFVPFVTDGGIYAIGGFGAVVGGATIDSVEEYRPQFGSANGSFKLLSGERQKLHIGRAYHTATRIGKSFSDFGVILIAGGVDTNGNAIEDAELFDARNKRFEGRRPDLKLARYAHAAAELVDGDVLLTGGCLDPSCNFVTNTAEVFNHHKRRFKFTKGAMHDERETQTETLLSDGTVLIAGGLDQAGNSLTTAEIYSPSTGTFAYTHDGMGNQTFLNMPRVGHSATLLPNGKVLIAGGASFQGNQVFDNGELYDPATGQFDLITGSSMSDPRFAHNAAFTLASMLGNGKVLLAGGYHSFLVPVATADLYTP